MKYIYAIWALLTFVGLFLIFFPLFIILSFMGASGRRLVFWLIKFWSHIWLALILMPTKRINLKSVDKKRNYIVVANHWSYLDTALIFKALPFTARPLAKKSLSKVPLFGYLYKTMAILVDRDSLHSKANSMQMLKDTIQKEHTSIFIFPEGTFNETDAPLKFFYDGAFKIAIETQTPILPVLFVDSKKRFHYRSFWNWTPGKNRVVFLPAIEVTKDENYKTLKDKVYHTMYTAMQQFN